jgi:hypothetical protein
MNSLDSMLERNRNFAVSSLLRAHSCLASASAAKCEGDHHRLR